MTKYLFKIGSRLKVVPSKEIDNLSPNEIIAIAISSTEEQQKRLIASISHGDQYFYGRNIVDDLERSLSKLEEKFPNIRKHIRKLVGKQVPMN